MKKTRKQLQADNDRLTLHLNTLRKTLNEHTEEWRKTATYPHEQRDFDLVDAADAVLKALNSAYLEGPSYREMRQLVERAVTLRQGDRVQIITSAGTCVSSLKVCKRILKRNFPEIKWTLFSHKDPVMVTVASTGGAVEVEPVTKKENR